MSALQVDGCLLEPLPPVVVRNASSQLFPGTVTETSIDEGIETEDEQSPHLNQCRQTLSEGTSRLGMASASGACKIQEAITGHVDGQIEWTDDY